jgi:hypothetical protein
MKNGKKMFLAAMNNDDDYDIDNVFIALDSFRFAISMSKDKCIELEAKAIAYIGKIHFKAIKNNNIAKEYFVNSI